MTDSENTTSCDGVTVAVGSAAEVTIAADPLRKFFSLRNTGAGTIFLSFVTGRTTALLAREAIIPLQSYKTDYKGEIFLKNSVVGPENIPYEVDRGEGA